MKHLTQSNCKAVYGAATPAEAFLGAALTFVGLSLLLDEPYYNTYYGYNLSPQPYYYYSEPTSYQVVTPVYDNWGYYQGDVVSNYYYY